MNDTAAWLVDRVLHPDVTWRQYVVSFPAPIAIGLCFRHALATRVVRLVIRTLFAHLRRRATTEISTPEASTSETTTARGSLAANSPTQPGAVVWLQRFSDGAGAWFHLHILTADAVLADQPGSLDVRWIPLAPPSTRALADLARDVASRVTRAVERHAETGPDDPLLVRCARQPATAVAGSAPPPTRKANRPHLLAEVDGFTIHAATAVPPNDTDALGRLVRCMARPPVPEARLERLTDGRIAFNLKRTRRGGCRQLLFTPQAFLARLAALIPLPMTQQTLYFGFLGRAASRRRYALPTPPENTPERPTAPQRPARMRHADLLKRVFAVDLSRCPCGGTLRVKGAIIGRPTFEQAFVAAMILSNQREAATAARPPRGPPTSPTHDTCR